MSETLGETRERLRREIEALPQPFRWLFRRRFDRFWKREHARREAAIRRYFRS